MAKLAIEYIPWLNVDTWEAEQKEWQTTITVLSYLDRIKNANRSPDRKVYIKFLCGSDLLTSFAVPNLWADEDIRKICDLYSPVIVPRPGSDAHHFMTHGPKAHILRRYADKIIIVDAEQSDISSTLVRNKLYKKESVDDLVPSKVNRYIQQKGLYMKRD